MKKELREKVWNKYNCKCAYCGEDLEYNKMQVDHVVSQETYRTMLPKYLPDYPKDDIRNLKPSCRGCNFYKGTYDLNGFRGLLKSMHERLIKIFIVRMAIRYGIFSYKPFDGKFYFEKLNNK